ncbi:MAG TPA: hypothetical protein VIK71_01805 [Flavobacteriales bacterium]
MNYQFPQYRRLANQLSYYKIESPSELLEIQRMGQRWTQHQLIAKILPERLLIQDILENEGGRYEIIDESAFNDFLKMCTDTLMRF